MLSVQYLFGNDQFAVMVVQYSVQYNYFYQYNICLAIINSRAYYKTHHVGRIRIFDLISSKIQKKAHRQSLEWGTRFPEWGIWFPEWGIRFPEWGTRFSEWETRCSLKRRAQRR